MRILNNLDLLYILNNFEFRNNKIILWKKI